MSKTILFLDFDGVLHPFPLGQDDQHFSQIQYLWKLLDANPFLLVVITSTWREKYNFTELLELLKTHGGEKYLDRFIGVTPILEDPNNYMPGVRQDEIKEWLSSNDLQLISYLILDDIEEYFHSNCKNLYLVDGSSGLMKSDVDNLGLWLKSI